MKMDTICIDEDTEREEGEIVDDDFEDISDNSIIVPMKTGKLSSRKDNLRALSLSSVSDADLTASVSSPRPRRKVARRRRSTKSLKRKRKAVKCGIKSGSASDSDDIMVAKKKLLKEAIRLDNTGELHRNSLRTRLKGMFSTKSDPVFDEKDVEIFDEVVEIDNNSEKDLDIEKEFVIEIKDNNEVPNNLEIDDELIQLRLEALKTAVFNKFQHRKKRKANALKENIALSDGSQKSDNLEIDKENTQDNINKDGLEEKLIKQACLENVITTTPKGISNGINESGDEDEDVLRAVLLASISKKITTQQENVILTKNVNGSNHHTVLKHSGTKYNLTLKSNYIHKNNNKLPIKARPVINIPKVKPLIINFNSDSDSEDEITEICNKKETQLSTQPKNRESLALTSDNIQLTVDKFLKEQRAQVEAKQSKKQPDTASIPLMKKEIVKSAVKLLPKNKQIEYQKLLLRLKNAEKKPRARRLSLRTAEVRNTSFKKLGKTKSITKPLLKPTDLAKDGEISVLHKTLKDMQVNQNGRLQIKGKYHVLTPLMRKINDASYEHKKHELQIKRLLNQLNEARTEYSKSHQNFTGLVKELIQKKETIDKSAAKTNVKTSNICFTSTPVKPAMEKFLANDLSSELPKTICAQVTNFDKDELQNKSIIGTVPSDILDPNDIIFMKRDVNDAVNVPKYISPLDVIDRCGTIDPYAIMCPYEINGSCRDQECTFKHYMTL